MNYLNWNSEKFPSLLIAFWFIYILHVVSISNVCIKMGKLFISLSISHANPPAHACNPVEDFKKKHLRWSWDNSSPVLKSRFDLDNNNGWSYTFFIFFCCLISLSMFYKFYRPLKIHFHNFSLYLAFRIPFFLKNLTINGADPRVIEILTGAKTLWIA